MGEPRSVMIAGGSDKNLCFVHQATERFGMNDAVAVTLEFRTHGAQGFAAHPPSSQLTFCGIRG
jgi:hypothetical protein